MKIDQAKTLEGVWLHELDVNMRLKASSTVDRRTLRDAHRRVMHAYCAWQTYLQRISEV